MVLLISEATCCIISQYVLKIDGVASFIAGLLGEFSQVHVFEDLSQWCTRSHGLSWAHSMKHLMILDVFGMSSSIIRIKDMWLGSINFTIERGKPVPCNVTGIPANQNPYALPGVWHHCGGILLRCEVGSFPTLVETSGRGARHGAHHPFGRGPVVYLVLSPETTKKFRTWRKAIIYIL